MQSLVAVVKLDNPKRTLLTAWKWSYVCIKPDEGSALAEGIVYNATASMTWNIDGDYKHEMFYVLFVSIKCQPHYK